MGFNSDDSMEWISRCYQATNHCINDDCVYVCVIWDFHKYLLLVYITSIIPDKAIKYQFERFPQIQIIE